MAHQLPATAAAATTTATATAIGGDLFTAGDAINTLSHHAPSLVSFYARSTCCPSRLFLVILCTLHYFGIRKPCQAGSVLECPDGYGGSLLIRIQNMAATGESIADSHGIIEFRFDPSLHGLDISRFLTTPFSSLALTPTQPT